MKVLIKASTGDEPVDFIDIYFEDDSVEGSTTRPETYTEAYKHRFHDFCNDIFNFMQSLERKLIIKLEYESKPDKHGKVDELGYRESARTNKQESYYMPFHVVTTRGRPTTAESHKMTVRISTHKITPRTGEKVLEYTIENWRDDVNYKNHKFAIKGLIDGLIKEKITNLKSKV